MKATAQNPAADMPFTIAIVDDDATRGETLAAWIGEMGHNAIRFNSGPALLGAIGTPGAADFSLILIDSAQPGVDSIEFVRQLRNGGRAIAPIILCTPHGDEADVVEALGADADDFIVKPVRRSELAARIGATLRRAYPRPAGSVFLTVPPFFIDLTNRVFHVDGQQILLQNLEYALALMLFQNLNGVVPRAHIIQSLWDGELMETSRTLDTHVSRIRRKLGLSAARGLIIQSVYGLGYRLQAVASPSARID
ncbi:MAG: response regulator transcription factor [Betaproteobacteria bacterium]